jgi:CDP-diacylglycerol--glycerol-3-phosphate 3-phosphatidyltransferase
MPSIYDLKPRFQALLRPLAGRLARSGVTANQVTVLAALLSLVIGVLVLALPAQRWPLLLIPVILFVRMALNAIDGMLAREHGMKTPLGGVLNELGDVISDAALYLPFAAIGSGNGMWVMLFVLVAAMGEMAGVLGVVIGASRRYDGPMGKSDRAFAVGLIALLLGLGLPVGIWLNGVWIVLLALGVVTLLNRVRAALREIA